MDFTVSNSYYQWLPGGIYVCRYVLYVYLSMWQRPDGWGTPHSFWSTVVFKWEGIVGWVDQGNFAVCRWGVVWSTSIETETTVDVEMTDALSRLYKCITEDNLIPTYLQILWNVRSVSFEGFDRLNCRTLVHLLYKHNLRYSVRLAFNEQRVTPCCTESPCWVFFDRTFSNGISRISLEVTPQFLDVTQQLRLRGWEKKLLNKASVSMITVGPVEVALA